jgi:uncharacterized membrane protein
MCAAHITEVCCIMELSFACFLPDIEVCPLSFLTNFRAVLQVKHFLALSLLIVHSITDTSVMPTQSVTSVVVAVVVARVSLLCTVLLAACVKCELHLSNN